MDKATDVVNTFQEEAKSTKAASEVVRMVPMRLPHDVVRMGPCGSNSRTGPVRTTPQAPTKPTAYSASTSAFREFSFSWIASSVSPWACRMPK